MTQIIKKENLKATNTTMLHKINVNTLKMNGKIEILGRDRNIKIRYQKLKNNVCFAGRMEMTKERVRKLIDKSIDII